MKVGDIFWSKIDLHCRPEWIRVAIDSLPSPGTHAMVRALFPGDFYLTRWSVAVVDLHTEQPFEIDSSDGDPDFAFA